MLPNKSRGPAVASPVVVMVANRNTGKVAERAFQRPVLPGNYRFYAFADANRNGVRDPDEAVSVAYTLSNPLRAGEMLELPAFEIR